MTPTWTIDQIIEHAKEAEQDAYKPEAHSVCIDNLAMCLQALIQNLYPIACATHIYQKAVDRWRERALLESLERILKFQERGDLAAIWNEANSAINKAKGQT